MIPVFAVDQLISIVVNDEFVDILYIYPDIPTPVSVAADRRTGILFNWLTVAPLEGEILVTVDGHVLSKNTVPVTSEDIFPRQSFQRIYTVFRPSHPAKV